MKASFFLLLAALCAQAASAREPLPLPRNAASAQAFAPPGWRVETQARGDLNADGVPDLAFILVREDSAPASPPVSGSGPPRMLVVALARRQGGYALELVNRHFLPRKRPPNGLSQGWMLFEDGSLEASRGRLRIIFEYTRSHLTFTFRRQSGALRLIGYESGGVAGGCVHHVSVNFLTSRARLLAGHVDRDEQLVRWRRLAPRPLVALDRIGDGEEFDPYGLVTRFPLSCPARE